MKTADNLDKALILRTHLGCSPPMQRVRANLPQVNTYPRARPSNAHTADAAHSTNTAKVKRRVKDIYMDEVTAMRYRCVGCESTFTRYSQGVDCNGCSVRLIALMSADVVVGVVAQIYGMRIDGAGLLCV